MKNANFDWAPFYEEFAEKLLEYKDNRESLVSKIKAAFDNVEKLDLPKLDDEGEFDDIDPFTVFSLFNRGLTDDNRKDIISQFKTLFDVKAKVPSSFDGIPIANAINAAFYDFKSSNRKTDAIDNIWKLFEATLNLAKDDNAETRNTFAKYFDIVINQPRIARAKLTIALYWIAPRIMLNLDNLNVRYIYSAGILPNALIAKLPEINKQFSSAEYLGIRDEILAYINSEECEYADLMEFSNAAFIYSKEKPQENDNKNHAAWLLNWNPSKWSWEEFDEDWEKTRRGNLVKFDWRCSSSHPAIGDDAFIMKLGEQPRGIVAHAKVVSAQYEDVHSDPKLAEQGRTAKYIGIEIDRIQNYKTEEYIPQEKLNKLIPNQKWSPQGSGIEIKEPGASQLKEMWNEITNKNVHESMGKTKMSNKEFDKNIILYGPPGTGKTYSSAIYAVAICDGKSMNELGDYDYVMKRYRELKAEGRIAFTTFHQSYGYEEFIEGIKPVIDDKSSDEVKYEIESGVFKRFCERAKTKDIKVSLSSEGIEGEFNSKVWHVLLDGTGRSALKEKCFSEGTIRIGWNWVPETVGNEYEDLSQDAIDMLHFFQDDMQVGDFVFTCRNLKTIDAIGIITGDYEYDDSEPEFPRKRTVKWLATDLDVDIPEINSGKQLNRDTVFPAKRITGEMLLDILQPEDISVNTEEENYVFVIDEINRGNISKIFGELITLIETTKRAGKAEAMEAILPYSREPFSVPSNVYILGTMNTADRSIALMDTALRRRFQFDEMMPEPEILENIGANIVKDNGTTLDVAKMLKVMNERIEYLFDREHTIGHAFFTGLKEEPTIEKLADIFQKSIIPLLQEYFYEDYSKIQLVLGDNGKSNDKYKFILDVQVKQRDLFNGNPDIDLPDNKFIIQNEAFMDINSYKEIGTGL